MKLALGVAAARGATARFRRGALAVFRHELRLIAHAPMTPLLIAGLLTALTAGVFVIGEFYSSDQASADLLWTFLPWAAVVFVPALAMRAYSEENGDRSLNLVMALPIADGAVVAGKWAAGVVILLVALGGTLPFVATIAYLGDPDWGALTGGFVGAALLLATSLALAHAAAAWTRDAAGGYLAGVVLLLALLLTGTDGVQRFLAGTPLSGVATWIASAGPKPWLDRMSTGRIEAGALSSFLALTGVALTLAWLALSGRRRQGAIARVRVRPIVVAAAGLAAVYASSVVGTRLPLIADLSAGRAFTLHAETVAAARGAASGTRIDLYWSADEARVPAAIKAHAARIRTLIGSLAARSGGRLEYAEHNAMPDTDADAAAMAAGLKRVPMTSGDSFVLGATLRHGDRQGAIPYLDIRREALVEYDFALALTTLARPRTPRLGILSPLVAPRNTSEPREGLAMLEELKRTYDVAIVPHFADALPDGLDALLVVGASILKRTMLYSIDQHVMSGKGLVVLVDPYARFNTASDAVSPLPSEEVDDISDLLLRYGVRFEPDGVIGDADLAAEVAGADERRIRYPFWLRVGRQGLSAAHAVTASLNEILLAEPGAFTSTRPDAVTALVTTTGTGTGMLSRKEAAGQSTEQLAAMFKADGRARILAAAIGGPFGSAFVAPPDGAAAAAGARHLERSATPAAVFAVADMDFIFDPLSLQHVVTGERSHARPLNDNIAFLANMVEAATGDPRLLAIRSRGSLQRPFTRVSRLLADAQERHRDEEARLVAAIGKVEADIGKIVEISGVKDASALPQPIRQRISALAGELRPYRQKLRQIRREMREEVDQLGRWLTLANLSSGPLLAAAFAAFAALARRRRHARADGV